MFENLRFRLQVAKLKRRSQSRNTKSRIAYRKKNEIERRVRRKKFINRIILIFRNKRNDEMF